MFHWQNIVSRNQTTSRYRASYEINPFTINSFIKLVDRMAVIAVWAFILCTRHRRHKTKEQTIMKTYQADFPWTENKDVFYFTSSVSSTRSFDWNLESINIWTNCQFIWSGKVYIWLSVCEFKKLCLWQPCLNKLMHVENWNTDHFQRYLYVDISYKFTEAWVFVSHACTQITINTFINDLVFFTVIILHIQ